MNVEYTFHLPTPVEAAWPTLFDVERVVPCVPGASIESGAGEAFTARLKVKLGPIEMTYRGLVRLVARDDAARRAVFAIDAKDVKGGGGVTASVTLSASSDSDGCDVGVASEFSVSGKAAQFGRGVMEDVGARLIASFAERLSLELQAGAGGNATPADAPAPSPTPPATNEALDVVGLTWRPILRRLAVPLAAVILIAAWLLWAYRASGH